MSERSDADLSTQDLADAGNRREQAQPSQGSAPEHGAHQDQHGREQQSRQEQGSQAHQGQGQGHQGQEQGGHDQETGQAPPYQQGGEQGSGEPPQGEGFQRVGRAGGGQQESTQQQQSQPRDSASTQAAGYSGQSGSGGGSGGAAGGLVQDSQGFRERWTGIQAAFVDEPRQAVEQADGLVAEVIQHLARSFAEERASLERQWAGGHSVSTEDLRVSLQRYRQFFQALLRD